MIWLLPGAAQRRSPFTVCPLCPRKWLPRYCLDLQRAYCGLNIPLILPDWHKQDGLYTVYVTNGYMTPEALDMLGPYLDAWRVDIKGFTDEFYRKLAGITHWEGILETAERAKKKWNMHIEVITNIIPTLNDDDKQLTGIAHWIRDNLGDLTPWHVTRFFPQYHARTATYPIATGACYRTG